LRKRELKGDTTKRKSQVRYAKKGRSPIEARRREDKEFTNRRKEQIEKMRSSLPAEGSQPEFRKEVIFQKRKNDAKQPTQRKERGVGGYRDLSKEKGTGWTN